jgi:hypothetical protein
MPLAGTAGTRLPDSEVTIGHNIVNERDQVLCSDGARGGT